MADDISQALTRFTQHYCQLWALRGTVPVNTEYRGIPSPCIISSNEQQVFWQPVPFGGEKNLQAVTRALGITLQPAVVDYYTTQYAADMTAMFNGRVLTLLQVWSEADFIRLQENLIGHLVMQQRQKASPTLFIATTDSEWEVISVCNLSGEVILEHPGTHKRVVLAETLADFLGMLSPIV